MGVNEKITDFIKGLYPNCNPVLLHCPEFLGNEKKYLCECIDTKFVSYIGHFVSDFEEHICRVTGAKYAAALVNGTEALHILFVAAGIGPGDEVVTQALSFAATAAAIVHSGASPVFVDVERETLGMSPSALRDFLSGFAEVRDGVCVNKMSGRRIRAVVPMHTLGHPARIVELKDICDEFSLMLFEDAAESLGSYFMGRHTGTFGRAGILSFNGNKTVTTGGGGAVITDDKALAGRVRYLSTTAKRPHRWEFFHDEAGFNLRLPSLNAAIGVAQFEYFDRIISNKRETASLYKCFFDSIGLPFITEPVNAKSNYWLNAILFPDRSKRDEFLEFSNDNGVQTRPAWNLLPSLPPYRSFQCLSIPNALFFEECLVDIPSSVRV